MWSTGWGRCWALWSPPSCGPKFCCPRTADTALRLSPERRRGDGRATRGGDRSPVPLPVLTRRPPVAPARDLAGARIRELAPPPDPALPHPRRPLGRLPRLPACGRPLPPFGRRMDARRRGGRARLSEGGSDGQL